MEIEEDLQRPDWIKIYMNLVIRNQGTESTIDRWRVVVLPPSDTPYLEDRRSLNSAQRGPHNLERQFAERSGNICDGGGTKEGWLLYEGPKDRDGAPDTRTCRFCGQTDGQPARKGSGEHPAAASGFFR